MVSKAQLEWIRFKMCHCSLLVCHSDWTVWIAEIRIHSYFHLMVTLLGMFRYNEVGYFVTKKKSINHKPYPSKCPRLMPPICTHYSQTSQPDSGHVHWLLRAQAKQQRAFRLDNCRTIVSFCTGPADRPRFKEIQVWKVSLFILLPGFCQWR